MFDSILKPKYSLKNSAWGAVSLGSVDPSLCGIAISPIGLSPNGGLVLSKHLCLTFELILLVYSCVVATLSSNMDLNLWTANKHHLKGDWPKVERISL